MYKNHYEWLEQNLEPVMKMTGFYPRVNNGTISAHGDKCYGYRDYWEKNGVPFAHGVLIYFLSYTKENWDNTSRNTPNGWVDPHKWVVSEYHAKWKDILKDHPY